MPFCLHYVKEIVNEEGEEDRVHYRFEIHNLPYFLLTAAAFLFAGSYMSQGLGWSLLLSIPAWIIFNIMAGGFKYFTWCDSDEDVEETLKIFVKYLQQFEDDDLNNSVPEDENPEDDTNKKEEDQ